MSDVEKVDADFQILPSWLTRSPLLWGGALTAGFYAVVSGGLLAPMIGATANGFVTRYCAGHPVVYAEVALFFVGIAALVIRRLDLAEQAGQLKELVLPPRSEEGNSLADCPELLESISSQPTKQRESYRHQRVERAVRHIWLKQSTAPLDSELKSLSEMDEARAHQALALPRFVTWAIPILGFLGTVIGITMAVASIDPTAMAASDPRAIDGVTRALSVAFDTTALALSLSLVLMFMQYRTQSAEFRLLAKVDDSVADELTGRFHEPGTGNDPQIKAVRRMTDEVVQATQRVVETQAELWRDTVDAAHDRWETSVAESQQQVQTALSHAIGESLQAHRQSVEGVGLEIAHRFSDQADRLSKVFGETASQLSAQQSALQDHAESMLRLANGTDQVAQLQSQLNQNLDALASSHNFAGTVESLAAVIHLLNARLAPANVSRADQATGQAA
ncbi:MAG: MotA/TolQ/ExbB proton channel family protein [Pirellulales bacterium]|nr:MotA/TolQ/ExbB proton channel family protein [Pirellulales bacterium]